MEGLIMRLPIEYGILSSLLHRQYIRDDELDKFLNFKLDADLFKANRTTKLVAKAIFNHMEEDLPFDDVLIEQYILKRTTMDFVEWTEIMSRLPMTFDSLLYYEKILKDMDKEEVLAKKMQEIG
jgi:hypothetical protein